MTTGDKSTSAIHALCLLLLRLRIIEINTKEGGKGGGALPLPARTQMAETTRTVMSGNPSMWPTMTSPGTTGPTFAGVQVHDEPDCV